MGASLNTLVSEAGKARTDIKRIVELTDACLEQFGGATGIAQKLDATYEEGNSATRAKVMDLVVKLVQLSIRAKGEDDDVTQMSEEELERELGIG